MTNLRCSVSTVTRWDTLQGNAEDLGTKIAETGIKTALEGIYMADDEVPTNMDLMALLDSELEKLKQEKESNQLKIENFDNAFKSLDKLIESQIIDKTRKGVGFVSYNVVLSPPTRLFSPLKFDLSNSGLKEFQQPEFEGYGPKTSKNVNEDNFNEVRESPDAPLVKELVSDDKLEKETIFPTVAKIEFVRPKQQEKPVKYAEIYRLTAITIKGKGWNKVPRAVLMKSGLRSLYTARPVTTAHPKTTVYSARPKSKEVNTAKPNSAVVNAVRENQGHLQKEDQGYVDSGCSRHMTGNMSYLLGFKKFDGGYVTFRGGAKGGKITGKGTLKTSKLDFEDVYFVKESQFNLFSVSQMCDKKNSVVIRNKARLVAQGCTKEEGIDYDEMDVKSAFMYEKIEEEVYVCQPLGFEDPEFPERVYKVENALYGLHQAPRAWYETLSTYLLDNGFQRGQIDKTLFIKRVKSDILLKFGFSTLKTSSTPMETSKPLMKDENIEDVDVHLYRSMIVSLMYVTSSRPDKMFVVCACARFQVTPNVSHLYAVKRIFSYLKCQPKLVLWYPKDSPFDLEAYFNSDYVGASLDKKSTTGGCQFLGSRLILWQCKKQTIISNSTTKAEYVVTASCCGQVLWIQNQMLDYGYNFINTKIFFDNESTICIVKNPVFYSKTKHIEIRHHFIRNSNEKKLIQMIKIHIDQNVADLLTKAFDVGRFKYLIASIGMLNL
ncbi:putative reverse transcriptase, RNA-dependent DNA polymerase [Tanacetum coccineum]